MNNKTQTQTIFTEFHSIYQSVSVCEYLFGCTVVCLSIIHYASLSLYVCLFNLADLP